MRKVLCCLIISILMLSCLSALAENELYTFAGIEWNTPKSEFAESASKKTGAVFTEYIAENPQIHDPSFVVKDGYYSVLGIPLACSEDSYIHAYYKYMPKPEDTQPGAAADAGWKFTHLEFESDYISLVPDRETGGISADDIQNMQDVIDNTIEKYGTPDFAWMCFDYYALSIDSDELPYIAADAFTYATVEQELDCYRLYFCFNNVLLEISVTVPDGNYSENGEGYYIMNISYMNRPFTLMYLRSYIGVWQENVFPLKNGRIPYIVIEP